MIKIIRERITEAELKEFLGKPFKEMIKFVVDVRREVAAFGGEMHADAEKVLLEDGARQADLWGGNIYPERPEKQRLEWNSLINIRPSAGNFSMDVQNEEIKNKMQEVIENLFR